MSGCLILILSWIFIILITTFTISMWALTLFVITPFVYLIRFTCRLNRK